MAIGVYFGTSDNSCIFCR